MPFALDVMDIPSPHYFELDFPNTEAALFAGHSSVLLVFCAKSLCHLCTDQTGSSNFETGLVGTLSQLQTMAYRKEHLLNYQQTSYFMHLLGLDTI